MRITDTTQPLAIAMWDVSWLERRWPGAGYEDWDTILNELKERGYDAVRIDAYPHFVAENPDAERELLPLWSEHPWGATLRTIIKIKPYLNEFIAKCKEHDVGVGLSTWFRQDVDDIRMKITSAQDHANVWKKTLRMIDAAGLLDSILYVDLCNEWPFEEWAPFFKNEAYSNLKSWSKDKISIQGLPLVNNWHTEKSIAWMEEAISELRSEWPDIPYCFSYTHNKSN